LIYDLIIAIILIVSFFTCVKAYTLGFKHGKEVSKGNIPKLDVNPVKAIKKHIEANETKKQNDLAYEGWNGENGIMNYDPYKDVKEGD
jgi:hypothetical protein